MDNIICSGVGVEQGQEFQRHKEVSFSMTFFITLDQNTLRLSQNVNLQNKTAETANLLEGDGQKWRGGCQKDSWDDSLSIKETIVSGGLFLILS